MPSFPAMGTEVTVHAPTCGPIGEALLAAEVARIFAEEERRYSRFRDDSELAELNRARAPMHVSRELLETIRDAQRWSATTAGLFDAGLGAALAGAGYDRSFAPGALDRDEAARDAASGSLSEVVIDERAGTVFRPAHVSIDLGGLVKGRTVDRAAALETDIAIDAGGDARMRGDDWRVDVEDPRDPLLTRLSLRVRDCAVATSAPNRRRWLRDGRVHHHLIDPRTNRPAESDLAQVTVVAATAEAADVLAKTLFLVGATAGPAFLRFTGAIGAVLIGNDGALTVVGALEVADD